MRRTVFEKQRRYTLNFPEGKFTEGEYICVMTNKSEALLYKDKKFFVVKHREMMLGKFLTSIFGKTEWWKWTPGLFVDRYRIKNIMEEKEKQKIEF